MITKPPAFKDAEDLQRKIDQYFAECEASQYARELKNGDLKIKQKFPSMSGLSVFLQVDRDTLKSYLNQEKKESLSDDELKQISATLINARERVKENLIQASLSGDADAKIAALLLTAMGETQPEEKTTVNVIIQGDSDAYSV